MLFRSGLLDVKNTSLNYVVGNPGPYTANIRVYQGEAKTTSIRIAKTFYSGTKKSNTISNFKTIAITDTNQNSAVSYSFTFTDMVAGLSVNGTPLSSSDTNYQIGDYWIFDYYVTNSNGEVKNFASTKATVSTRYAGTYNVAESAYFRLGVASGSWTGNKVVIESIDANIYKHNGLAFWDDNAFYFTVDNSTGKITVMDKDPAGAAINLNSMPIMTCLVNQQFAVFNPCATEANKVTQNNVTGADVLQITVGYYTGGSGPREFTEKLVKVVN